MSKRNPKLLLADIIEAVEKIKTYTAGFSYEQFLSDSKTADAVIRNFEIIGFRNRIIHDYMGVDYQIVWTIIQKDLGRLESEIKSIFEKL